MPSRPPQHRLGWQPPPAKQTDPFYGTQEWKRLRQLVRERDLGSCRGVGWTPSLPMSSMRWLCGCPATRVDHIKPRAEGGPDHPSNLRLLCTDCDAKRHAEKATVWR